MSFISKHFDMFRYTSYAIGMDYSKEKLIEYNLKNIREKQHFNLPKLQQEAYTSTPKSIIFKQLRAIIQNDMKFG